MSSLPDRLRSILFKIDTNPTKLANEMGHSNSYLTNIINGVNKNPSHELYEYFQVRFNVSPKWLKFGDGDPFLPGGLKDDTVAGLIIMKFNALPASSQNIVKSFIDIAYEKEQLEKELKSLKKSGSD